MKKKQIQKLSMRDHTIYILIYAFLCSFTFSFWWVSLLRDRILLHSREILAYSNGWGVLWCIPSMLIAFVAIAYFGWCENHKLSVKQAIVSLFRKPKVKWLVVIFIILLLATLSLSLFSSWHEFRTDGFYSCNIFGIEKKLGDLGDVNKVTWAFGSTYVAHGRGRSSVSHSLSCEINLNQKKLSFHGFELSNLLLMNEALKDVPYEIINDDLINEWISDINCDEELRNEIYKIFVR